MLASSGCAPHCTRRPAPGFCLYDSAPGELLCENAAATDNHKATIGKILRRRRVLTGLAAGVDCVCPVLAVDGLPRLSWLSANDFPPGIFLSKSILEEIKGPRRGGDLNPAPPSHPVIAFVRPKTPGIVLFDFRCWRRGQQCGRCQLRARPSQSHHLCRRVAIQNGNCHAPRAGLISP